MYSKNINQTEAQLRKLIQLASYTKEKAKTLVENYKNNPLFIKKIKQIASNFGLKYNIQFETIIVSAEKKYLFNYLSWWFSENDSWKIAKQVWKFIHSTKFKNLIKTLSARAIFDKNPIEKASESLNKLIELWYKTTKWTFYKEMQSLCEIMIKSIENKKGIILVWVSSTEKVQNFDNLLAHEIFHLIAISNGIWFQWINEKYADIDEWLANLLTRRYGKRWKDSTAVFWEESLMPDNKTRIKKIKEIFIKYKKTGDGVVSCSY